LEGGEIGLGGRGGGKDGGLGGGKSKGKGVVRREEGWGKEIWGKGGREEEG